MSSISPVSTSLQTPGVGSRVIIAPSSPCFIPQLSGVVGTIVSQHANWTREVQVFFDNGELRSFPFTSCLCEDLKLIDTGPTGLLHPDSTCITCHDEICGFLFQCASPSCSLRTLCTPCYMSSSDSHTSHPFLRFDSPLSSSVPLPARTSSVLLPLTGTFPHALVSRGPHWQWGKQDQDQIGRVLSVGAHRGFARSKVDVRWPHSLQHFNYRRGLCGRVDIVSVECSSGGTVFEAHLPFYGEFSSARFKRFDLVRVQDQKGGVQMGFVEYVCPDGFVGVHTHSVRFARIHPKNLEQDMDSPRSIQRGSEMFSLGEELFVLEGWSDHKKGFLRLIHKDRREFTVQDGDDVFTLSMDAFGSNDLQERIRLLDITKCHQGEPPAYSDRRDLVALHNLLGKQEFNSGAMHALRALLRRISPELIRDAKLGETGMTALHLAAVHDDSRVLQAVLAFQGDCSVVDSEGNTPLHLACQRANLDSISTLVQNGAQVNVQDKQGRTPVHLAAGFSCEVTAGRMLQILFQARERPDFTLKDARGETAVLTAYNVESLPALRALIGRMHEEEVCDLARVRNAQGVTLVQMALRENIECVVELILEFCPRVANVILPNGFLPVHYAILERSSLRIFSQLVELGADVHAGVQAGITPLQLAIQVEAPEYFRVLIQRGCSLELTDENGDTPLHHALMALARRVPGEDLMRRVLSDVRKVRGLEEVWEVVEGHAACAMVIGLLRGGVRKTRRNLRRMTPLESVEEMLGEKEALMISALLDRVEGVREDTMRESEEDYRLECAVCMDRRKDRFLDPCGHTACQECAEHLVLCPICRRPVLAVKMLFL